MDPNTELAGTPASETTTNPFSRRTGALIAPVSTFQEIARKPDWIIPLILIIALSIVAAFIQGSKLDLESSLREQFSESKMTQEQIDDAVEISLKIQKIMMPLTVIIVPVFLVITAGILLLSFRVMAGEVGFLQSLGITLYAWLPQALKAVLMAVLIAMRDKVTAIEAATILKSNLGFLSDPIEQPIAFAVLSSIDVFNFWTVALLGIGFAFAAKWPRPKAVALVAALYVVIIVLILKIGPAALQSLGGSA
ncbi:MAG: Yip1 family protein [Thermoanaerobaculia bacterium]